MAAFTVTRRTSLTAEEAWARLTDWERHGDFIPLTTVTATRGAQASVGDTFVAHTRAGPLSFDDPMEVTFWQPPAGMHPGVCRIVKRGRVVRGWAVLTVTDAARGATIQWQEEARVRYVGGWLAWPNKLAGAMVFGRLVDGLLADSASARK